jgi:hypothetical protein
MRPEICNAFNYEKSYADLYSLSGVTRIIIEFERGVCDDESTNGQLHSHVHQADPCHIEWLHMHKRMAGYSPHKVSQPRGASRTDHAAA